jgi:hypothetical protein
VEHHREKENTQNKNYSLLKAKFSDEIEAM